MRSFFRQTRCSGGDQLQMVTFRVEAPAKSEYWPIKIGRKLWPRHSGKSGSCKTKLLFYAVMRHGSCMECANVDLET